MKLRLAILVALYAVPGFVYAAEQRVFPERLRHEFTKLFVEFYPRATNSFTNGILTFEYNTTMFQIPVLEDKQGKRGPLPERGPRQDGVRAEISFGPGKLLTQLSTPHTGDEQHYKHFIHNRFSARTRTHLYVHLYFPRAADRRFVERFKELVNGFDRYIDETK
jgi:hypothetical protein